MAKGATASIVSLLNTVRKHLSEEDKIILDRAKVMVREEILRLQKAVELHQHANKKIAPIEKRYVKIIDAKESNSKFTYRPESGEILIKIARGTSQFKQKEFEKLGELAMKQIPMDIPVTLRGTIHWSETNSCARVCIQSESKKFVYNLASKESL